MGVKKDVPKVYFKPPKQVSENVFFYPHPEPRRNSFYIRSALFLGTTYTTFDSPREAERLLEASLEGNKFTPHLVSCHCELTCALEVKARQVVVHGKLSEDDAHMLATTLLCYAAR